jgi:sialate O-acetylesterase
MKKISLLFIYLLSIVSCTNTSLDITISSLFADHMVLQRQKEVPVWGWAAPATIIKISASWGESSLAKADTSGRWLTKIQTPKAGGPYVLNVISGSDTVKTINDIMIGEVWLASGQSNMEMPVKGLGEDTPIENSVNEITNSENKNIRMFTVKKTISYTSKQDCIGEWKVANSKNTGDFSATAYFFAKNLNNELKIPIGIINASWGGTPIESWIAEEYIKTVNGYKDVAGKINELKTNIDVLSDYLKDTGYFPFSYITQSDAFTDTSFIDKRVKSTDFDDSEWHSIVLPDTWDNTELKNINGIVWFRKDFDIPENINPASLNSLFLGKIDEMDETYINGVKIGSNLGISSWTKERAYNIDKTILHKGKNNITIKMINTYGGGGFYTKKDIILSSNSQKEIINLSGKWKYKPVAYLYRFNSEIYLFTDRSKYNGIPKYDFLAEERTATLLYNGMIAPIIPFYIKGAIWYQGESNVGKAKQYDDLFPTLIRNWRAQWGEGDFPFYYVQIAPYSYVSYGDNTIAAKLRFSQFKTLKEKNVGMVVTTDIGNINNIHPSNKQEVGKRLSLWALHNTYGFDSKVYSGPLYKSCEIISDKAIVSFTHTAGGLICKGNKLTNFEIAGTDSIFYDATAKIDKNKVIVYSKNVRNPKFVRFGWKNAAEPNLFNAYGLPASPFKN